ncbi:MAG: hypothetical protein J5685_02030 [Clostridiales bacterium]|nr:hypothetical protein [Clostridiales bacterium]
MNKRNFVKLGCVFLSAALLAPLTGCMSKATPANFRKLEKKLDAELYEADDLEELQDIFGEDFKEELEDGVIFVLSQDCIGNAYEESLDSMGREGRQFSELYYGDNFDPESDILSSYVYAQGTAEDDEVNLVFASMVEFKDKKTADFIFADFLDNMEGLGWLSKFVGNRFDVEDFNSSEYSYRRGSSGHVIFNYSYESLLSAIDANEDIFDLIHVDPDDFLEEGEDVLEDLRFSMGIYFSGNTITYVTGVSSTGDDLPNLAPLCSTLGLKDPSTVTNSDALTTAFITVMIPYSSSIGRYLTMARLASGSAEPESYSIDDYIDGEDEDIYEEF